MNYLTLRKNAPKNEQKFFLVLFFLQILYKFCVCSCKFKQYNTVLTLFLFNYYLELLKTTMAVKSNRV